MRLKKKKEEALYHELKVKLVNLLAHDDEEVNLQAGELLLSMDTESVTDFIHVLFYEFEQLLVENQTLVARVNRAELLQGRARDHAQNTTRIGMDFSEIPWND